MNAGPARGNLRIAVELGYDLLCPRFDSACFRVAAMVEVYPCKAAVSKFKAYAFDTVSLVGLAVS